MNEFHFLKGVAVAVGIYILIFSNRVTLCSYNFKISFLI